jgi:hypothetical protein
MLANTDLRKQLGGDRADSLEDPTTTPTTVYDGYEAWHHPDWSRSASMHAAAPHTYWFGASTFNGWSRATETAPALALTPAVLRTPLPTYAGRRRPYIAPITHP